jgi:hypothetical protein
LGISPIDPKATLAKVRVSTDNDHPSSFGLLANDFALILRRILLVLSGHTYGSLKSWIVDVYLLDYNLASALMSINSRGRLIGEAVKGIEKSK